MQQPLRDFFGRFKVTLEQIEAEEKEAQAKRWAKKVNASKEFGTPPEKIIISSMYQRY
jgi:hypothetical protein